MSEIYPDDVTLLALTQDVDTGVEYIATGRSPYYLEFRRLLQRLLLAAGRANDLRVYQDGNLTIGVRAGRCRILNTTVTFAGTMGTAVTANATTYLWLDAGGLVQQSTTALPTDRTGIVPLAMVVASATAIISITDLRGEVFLGVADLTALGVTATAAKINAALTAAHATVTADALNRLTGGGQSDADVDHRHLYSIQDVAGPAYFSLVNINAAPTGNIGLVFRLLHQLDDDLVLAPDTTNGCLTQSFDGKTYHCLGAVHVQSGYAGALTSSQNGRLGGVVPVTGVVQTVTLSVGTNLQSSTGADGITATAKVNGVALTTTAPRITSAAGSGFRSTARGQGTAAVVKTDGTQNVQRGDVITVDLTRTAGGTVSVEAADVVVLVVVRAAQAE